MRPQLIAADNFANLGYIIAIVCASMRPQLIAADNDTTDDRRSPGPSPASMRPQLIAADNSEAYQ